MRKVWKNYFDYTLFRPYIQWTYKGCYSHIEIRGRENLPDPQKACVILAPNHCNTMMDSLLVLQSRKEPVFFAARADIFKKPFFAAILNNLRILPIYRKRDGADSGRKNVAIFNDIVEGLENGIAFCIHPEGTHRARRSLLPMKHGVFHIAQKAVEQNPQKPVYIVPVGLEYEDYYNLMRGARISFGEPMKIDGDETMDELSKELYRRISSLITFFPDDENLGKAEEEWYESRKKRYNALHFLLAAILLPFFVVSGFLCSPILLASAKLCSGLKDKVWMNTVRYSCKLALTPFTAAGAAVAGFCTQPWYIAVALVIATVYSHPVFYSIYGFYKRLLATK